MALTFGANTSDRVECGTGASITSLNPFTVLMWVMPTTLTSNRTLFHKGDATNRKRFQLSGTAGDVALAVDRGTGDTNYVTNTTPLASLNTWIFLAASFASASTPSTRIFKGTCAAAAVESTYSTAANGTGTVDADTGGGLTWGNRPSAGTATVAFQGRIAYAAYVAKEMSLAEIIRWQFRPRMTPETRNFLALGFNGTGTQPDWSGNANAGTVTGATQSAHVPLGQLFVSDLEWAGAYILTGGGSNVTVTPTTATLTTTAFAPVVSTPRLVTTATASLILTKFAPTVSTPRLVTPTTKALALTTFAPTVSVPRLATPATKALTLTTFAPVISAPRTVTPGTASLILTGLAPTVTIAVGNAVTPAPAALVLTTFAPNVVVPRTVTPGPVSLILTGFAPSAVGDVVVPVASDTGGGGGGGGGGNGLTSEISRYQPSVRQKAKDDEDDDEKDEDKARLAVINSEDELLAVLLLTPNVKSVRIEP